METLENSLKFRQWKALLESNGVVFKSIEPLELVHKPNGELLFALLRIDAHNPDGEKLLPVVLLRGHFVTVVTVLTEEESGQEYLLLVRQTRVSHGKRTFEHPAGMCDSTTDAFAVAVKEVSEETGLKIDRSQLRLLTPEMAYTSAGLLDEGGYIFACELRMPKAELDTFRNKTAGAENESEFIQTYICTIPEAMPLMDSVVSKLALFMYLDSKK